MSEKKYILAHDMGTSSDKAVLVDFAGNIAATSSARTPPSTRTLPGSSRIRRITGRPWR